MDPGSHVGFQISTKNINLVESCDPDLHPRWPPSADIVLTYDPMGKMFKKNFI
jgi:hypothetical protein